MSRADSELLRALGRRIILSDIQATARRLLIAGPPYNLQDAQDVKKWAGQFLESIEEDE